MTEEKKQPEKHQTVCSVERLLDELLAVSQLPSEKLVVVHVSWHSCPGCFGPLETVLLDLEKTHNVLILDVPWRTENNQYAYDYRYRITAVYRIWEQLVLGKLQRLGGFQEVETYPVPPWDRPHFPQVFLIDNRAIDQSCLEQLKSIHSRGGLVNSGNEVMLFTKEKFDAIHRTSSFGTFYGTHLPQMAYCFRY